MIDGAPLSIVTWNMGCAFGQTYKRAQERAWEWLRSWTPDVALLQEVMTPPSWVDPSEVVFTSYGYDDRIGTAVWTPSHKLRRGPALPWVEALEPAGQVTTAELDGLLLASIHANTKELVRTAHPHLGADLGNATNGRLFPLDVVLEDLGRSTDGRRFIVGGDLNAALRFDKLYKPSSVYHGNEEWFRKARAAGWLPAHPKFHSTEQRTLFRPGKDEDFQLDHLFCDEETLAAVTSCDVVEVPDLAELSDHAPLSLRVR